jgi:Calx-beta domain
MGFARLTAGRLAATGVALVTMLAATADAQTGPRKLRIADAELVEAPQNMRFVVRLSRKASRTVKVNYDTIQLTATPSDYEPTTGTLRIKPGKTKGVVKVPVKEDTVAELSETFAVDLSDPTRATLADAEAVGTIVDDD